MKDIPGSIHRIGPLLINYGNDAEIPLISLKAILLWISQSSSHSPCIISNCIIVIIVGATICIEVMTQLEVVAFNL